MTTARERARALCERGHGYGQAVDPYCAQCRKIAAALIEERARAIETLSPIMLSGMKPTEVRAYLDELAQAARRGE
jgi:hypothetical protein